MSVPEFSVEYAELKARTDQLRRDMGKVPPEMRTAMRRAVREIGQEIVIEGRTTASWSKTIPSAFRVETRFGGSRMPGVIIRVANKGATVHARPYEGMTGYRWFRHPVFADAWNQTPREWTWVSQRTRPFLAPAVAAHYDTALDKLETAVFSALRSAGFRL